MYYYNNIQAQIVETICTSNANCNKRRLDTADDVVPDLVLDTDDCSSTSSSEDDTFSTSKVGVRFSAHLSYSTDTTALEEGAHETLWYQNNDYERFRNENKIIVRFALAMYRRNCISLVKDDNDDTANDTEDTICVRGLEHKVYEDYHEVCRSSRKCVVTAVLAEQHRQRTTGLTLNEKQIRKGSIKFSKECKQLARTLGKLDAKKASRIL